jgi:hypothetical protein
MLEMRPSSPQPRIGDQWMRARISVTFQLDGRGLDIASLSTRREAVHDFLANPYFATAPFDVPGVGRAKWRLTPERASQTDGIRGDRLVAMVATGEAALRLEVRRTWTTRYVPVARVILRDRADIDQEELRFDPSARAAGSSRAASFPRCAAARTPRAKPIGRGRATTADAPHERKILKMRAA